MKSTRLYDINRKQSNSPFPEQDMKIATLVLFPLVLAAGHASAEGLVAPKGEVILTVTGDLAVTNGEHSASFDEAMLRDLGTTSFHTSTIWTEGAPEFTGVSLATLVQRLGITAGDLEMVAVNDYSVTVPVSDAVTDGPIIAYAMNGKPMSIREKGPLWLVYPYDLNKAYQSETIYSRSIWQLVRIDQSN
jgi:hypothetical protein